MSLLKQKCWCRFPQEDRIGGLPEMEELLKMQKNQLRSDEEEN